MEKTWDNTDSWAQAMSLAYSQLREYEDSEEHKNLLRVQGAKI